MEYPEIELRQGAADARVPARLRLFGTLLLVAFTALLPRQLSRLYLIPGAILLIAWIESRMPARYFLRRLLVAEVFVLGIGALSLVNPASTPVFVSAVVKSNLCVFAMLLLTWTTPFHKILQELRRCHFPSVMLTTLALMYRYLPVLAEESRRMSRARASRTFARRRLAGWQSVTTIIAQLFIRSAERAERIYLAMCARGWK